MPLSRILSSACSSQNASKQCNKKVVYGNKLDRQFYNALVKLQANPDDIIELSKTLSNVLIEYAIALLKPVQSEYNISDELLSDILGLNEHITVIDTAYENINNAIPADSFIEASLKLYVNSLQTMQQGFKQVLIPCYGTECQEQAYLAMAVNKKFAVIDFKQEVNGIESVPGQDRVDLLYGKQTLEADHIGVSLDKLNLYYENFIRMFEEVYL